jgi:hypothetical protein
VTGRVRSGPRPDLQVAARCACERAPTPQRSSLLALEIQWTEKDVLLDIRCLDTRLLDIRCLDDTPRQVCMNIYTPLPMNWIDTFTF